MFFEQECEEVKIVLQGAAVGAVVGEWPIVGVVNFAEVRPGSELPLQLLVYGPDTTSRSHRDISQHRVGRSSRPLPAPVFGVTHLRDALGVR
jgi:hypothetical protein